MKSDKANVWTSILVASTVGWFFFGVLPIQSYLSCQSQFPFSLGDLLQEYAVTGVIVTAALATILHFLSRGFGLWAHVLLLSGVVCCILESGPLSIDLPEFNGVFDGYKLVWRMVADCSAWLLVIVLSIVFYKGIKPYVRWVSVAVAFYSLAMIFDVKMPAPDPASPADSEVQLVPREDVVHSAIYADGYNVMMFIIDAVSTDAAAYAFEQDPSLKEKFVGFVNYTNNVGMHLTTAVAVPGIMTGEYCQGSRDAATYGKRPYKRGSWLFDYEDAGFEVYSNLGISPKGYANRLNPMIGEHAKLRPSDVKTLGTFAWSIDALSLVRILPYALKERYVRRLTSVSRDNGHDNIESDGYLWPYLAKAPIVNRSKKTLNIHHTYGGHVPIVFDRDGNRITPVSNDYNAYKEQCLYVFRQLAKLMDGYRDRGLYDHSAIIILADHGSYVSDRDSAGNPIYRTPYPALLVKTPGCRRPYEMSSEPTSHAKISEMMRKLISGGMSREECDSVLRAQERFYRVIGGGSIIDNYVSEGGVVSVKKRGDLLPTEGALGAVHMGVPYSFDVTNQEQDYPEFMTDKGERTTFQGLGMHGEKMTVRIRSSSGRTPITIRFAMTSWDHNLYVEAVAGENDVKSVVRICPGQRNRLELKGVQPDENGFVSVDFSREVLSTMVVLMEMEIETCEKAAERSKATDMASALSVGKDYSFSKEHAGIRLVRGFSTPEPFGVWCEDGNSVLRVVLPKDRNVKALEFSAYSFKTVNKVFVMFEGRSLCEVDASNHSGFTIEVDCAELPREVPVDLEFIQPGAARPCDVNPGSTDVRKLGLALRSVRLKVD